MINLREMQEVIDQITYKPGWEFTVQRERAGGRAYLQATVTEEMPATGDNAFWRSAKYYLSYHMCRQEIVGVAFNCVRDAEEHEMREWFRYRDSAIYNPHLDPDILAEIASRLSSFVMRENPMTMEETE